MEFASPEEAQKCAGEKHKLGDVDLLVEMQLVRVYEPSLFLTKRRLTRNESPTKGKKRRRLAWSKHM